jgi:hypothetical protein
MKRIAVIFLLMTSPLFAAQPAFTNFTGNGNLRTAANWDSGATPGGPDRCMFLSNLTYDVKMFTGGLTNEGSVFNTGTINLNLSNSSAGIWFTTNCWIGSNSANFATVNFTNGWWYTTNTVVGSNTAFNVFTIGASANFSALNLRVGTASPGNSNTLQVIGGGKLTTVTFNNIASGNSGKGNTYIVAGAGSIWTNATTFAFSRNSPFNSLYITNGGKVFCTNGNFTFPQTAGASNNLAVISGVGSVCDCNGTFGGGVANAYNNSVYVTNGGMLLCRSGGNSYSISGDTFIRISDSGSIFTNNGTSGRFLLELNGSRIELLNGGTYSSQPEIRLGESSPANGDSFIVSDVGTLLNAPVIYSGYGTSTNNLFQMYDWY